MADILEFLSVQCTPQGFRLGAHCAAYSANGGQDPQNFSADLVALGGFENTSLNLAWRAYDRATRFNNDVNGVTFFAWQGPNVYALTPPTWTAVFNIPDQAVTLDSGVHTGLYHVNTNGQEYLCGLYALAAGTGFVKYDPRTNTWSRGAFPSAATPGSTMGKCVQLGGKLYHPTASGLQVYDPADDSLAEVVSTDVGAYAKLAVASGRLFILPSAGTARLMEYVYGAVVQIASLAAQPFGANYTSGGDNLLMTGLPGINTNMLAIWNCQTGGSGFRAHEITGISGVPGSSVTVTENNVVIPDGSPGSLDFTGFGPNVSYASGTAVAGNANYQFTEGGWNLEWGPLFSATPAAFAMLKLNFGSFTAGPPSLPPGLNTSYRIDWNGSGAVMNYVYYDNLDNGVSVSFSQNSSPWGTSQRLFANGPSVTALTSEPYQDGSITRGMLLKFRIADSLTEIPNTGGELYLGYARNAGRPATRCALSVGANPTSFPGGVATFDAANNRLTDVPPTGPGRTTMTYGSPAGPGFVVGDVVTGTLSGNSGTVGIVGPPANSALFLHSVTGAFTANEPLTSTSGTTATMLGTEASPTYQIVWDQDTDAVPELEFVSVQGAHWVVEAIRQYVTGPNYQLQVLTADTLSPTNATPETTASVVAENNVGNPAATAARTASATAENTTNSSAAAAKTASIAAEELTGVSSTPETTGSAVSETITRNSATPTSTTSVVHEEVPDAIYPPNLYARVPARAHSQPGWINFQTDGVGVGGDQPTANLLDSASDPTEPRGAQSGAPVDGDVKAVASFELGVFGAPQVGVAALEDVDLKVAADTSLLTVPAGFEAVIFGASVRCKSATAISAPATARIGFDGPASNLFGPQLLVALTAQDDSYDYPVGGESVIAPAGSVILFRVDAGATGAAQAGEVTLFGYLRRA